MNRLELNTNIITNFEGEINSHIVTNEDVYYTVQNILEFVVITQLPFTKWQDFIADLIKAFEELKSSGINDDYNYAESKVIEASAEMTNVDSLKNAFTHLVEVQYYPEFKDIYNKLKNNYYTS
mgnify:FL=1|jgi:hypothetical protein